MPVYLIRQGVTGPVKIGVANDVVKRVRQLQTNQPIVLRLIRVLDGDRAAESALHQRFHSQRLAGEWFSFSAEMESDLGYPDLPIPNIKRNNGRGHPDNAWGRERCLHDEILIAIGGGEALARRMRLPPWEVASLTIKQRYWSATILLLNDAGRSDITLDMLFEAREAVVEEGKKISARNAAIETKRQIDLSLKREKAWVETHGPNAAWWPLSEPEEEEPIEVPATEAEEDLA